jgi:N-acetylneuraminic acid mutarotase
MKRAWLLVGCCVACGGGSSSPSDASTNESEPLTCGGTLPWASAPELPLGPTQETAVVATGGKLYVLGGFDRNIAIVDAVQVFDPVACKWSMGPALPARVHHANAAVVGGTIYVLGALGANFGARGDVWAWNPATDTAWATKASMPAGSERGSAVTGVIDDKIYVAGGLRNGAVTDFSVYDPAMDMWTTGLPALPMSRDHGCGGVIGGKVYVAGGREGTIGTTRTTVYEYTPGGNAWVERAPMPTGRGGTACGVVNDRLVVVGGEGNPDAPSGVFPQVEAYDAMANTWATLEPMPTPRHGMGAAAIGNKLYVPGGATMQGFGAVATHEILTPL